jgi:hypothetical protein
MPFTIKASDTSGVVVLRRDTVPAALKKAAELRLDGCWDVEIISPDGTVYSDDPVVRPSGVADQQEVAN